MIRIISRIGIICLLLGSMSLEARAESDKRVLKIMTRNMDAGTDLLWFFVVPDVSEATALTFNEVVAADLPAHAELLADEIARQQPDVIALQEVTLWTSGPPNGPPLIVIDQLQLLLHALARRHLNYAAIAVNNLTGVSAPASATQIVSFLDRDVVLARTDLKNSELNIQKVQQNVFTAKFGFHFGPFVIPVLRGWISVDVKVRGKVVRIIDTHLESLVAVIPETAAVQEAQTSELLSSLRQVNTPVVIAGDFNANANAGPDQSASIPHILASGFQDAWLEFNGPNTGNTWPLFLEDFNRGAAIVPPFERIDLIFTRSLKVLGVAETGLTQPWPSDHAGVVATVLIEP